MKFVIYKETFSSFPQKMVLITQDVPFKDILYYFSATIGVILMNPLIEIFCEAKISKQKAVKIANLFSKKEFTPGDYFLQQGSVDEYIGFIEEGIFHYFYKKNRTEITTYIACKGDFILSVSSFFNKTPSKESIRALTDSGLWIMSKKDFSSVMEKYPEFKNFYIRILEKLLVNISESRFEHISLTAEEKYQKMISGNSQILDEIPEKFVHSVLGISTRKFNIMKKQMQEVES